MTKQLGWEHKVQKTLEEYEYKEFEWGKHDCLCMVDECLEDMLPGLNLMENTKGKYKTLRGAMGLIKRKRGSMEAIFDKHFQEVPILKAQRGDACIVYLPKVGPTFGLVALDGKTILMKSEKGVLRIPVNVDRFPVRAWRVE